MKKILTAIGNRNLNDELEKKEKYNIVSKDIQYKEGILEFLNMNSNIDVLIISELLDGTIEFKELINEIIQINENIEIIVFLEDEKIELRSFLYSKGISKIYINNEIDIETFIINLDDNVQEKTNELNKEIQKLKAIIEKQEKEYSIEKKKAQIIVVAGAYGSGKSIFSCILCKEFVRKGKKTLIIDFDIFNSSINVLYNVPKYAKTANNLRMKNQIIKISKNEHVLCAADLFFKEENTTYINLEEKLREVITEYDQIIIDTTSNFKYKYQQQILNIANVLVFLVIPSIIEIKKANSLFEVYNIDFKIPTEKIKIVVNKVNSYSVDNSIIAKIFNTNKISGKMKYIEEIESNINKRIKKSNMNIDSLL